MEGKLQNAVSTLALSLCASLFLAGLPTAASAHQLTNPSGRVLAHQHSHQHQDPSQVVRRGNFGQGLITGRRVPTRFGHDMIIWSPAPSSQFGTPSNGVILSKPVRQMAPRRTQRGSTIQFQTPDQDDGGR